MSNSIRVAAMAIAAACLAFPAFASVEYRIEHESIEPLRQPEAATRAVTMRNVPLVDGRAEDIELEPFDIMAPGAVIEFREGDSIRKVEPTPMRQFRGYVAGIPESIAYVSLRDDGAYGLIIVRERKFLLHSRASQKSAVAPTQASRRKTPDYELFIAEVDPSEDFAIGASEFVCGVEGTKVRPEQGMVPQSLAFDAAPNAFTWTTATQTTMLNLVVETDSAMYSNFGNSVVAVETFTRDLVGAASVIYNRDLRTDLRISDLNVNGATDPWSVVSGSSNTLAALLEYGDYWHTTPPLPANQRSAGVLLSGSYSGTPASWSAGGIAWVDALCIGEQYMDPDAMCGNPPSACYPDPYAGHYLGPYAFCGGIGVEAADRIVPDPDQNASYVANTNGYWPLMEFAHELGHVVQSGHTHCIKYDGVNYVDQCYGSEGGCYSGTISLPAPKGTIMSYCHLAYGGTGTRYTFGQTAEPSEIIVDNMRARLDNRTPTGLSAITAPASLASGATGAASVTNTGSLTFDWTIVNGTFTGGATTAAGNSVSFSGTSDPVTLRVTATNANGCAISDYKSVTITSALAAPTNVQAIFSSESGVFVSWSGSDGATSYTVWRSDAGGSYTNLGSPTPNPAATSFLDTTASPNSGYFYQVEAHNGSGSSPLSGADVATTVVYTDPSLTAGMSAKAAHLTELRTTANLMRALTGSMVVPTYTDPAITPGSTVIKAIHFEEVETVLRNARASLGMSVPAALGFAAGGAIHASDISTLRTYGE